jgi:uncharacterized membrane protein HdeD (DUF308 family)
MFRLMINNWWLLLLRAAFALVFAIFVFSLQPFVPTLLLTPVAFTSLVVLFGLLASVCGLITVAASLRGAQKKRDAWTLLTEGVIMTAAGAAVLFVPGLTLRAVIFMIAGATALLGLLEITAGIHLRRHLADERLLLAGGVASLACWFYLSRSPVWALPRLLNWIAAYAAVNGLAMAGLALRLRGLRGSVHDMAAPEHRAGTEAGKGSSAA